MAEGGVVEEWADASDASVASGSRVRLMGCEGAGDVDDSGTLVPVDSTEDPLDEWPSTLLD